MRASLVQTAAAAKTTLKELEEIRRWAAESLPPGDTATAAAEQVCPG